MHLSYHKHTLRFKQPAGTSRGVYRTRTVWYIVVSGTPADPAAFGIGECAPLPDLSCDAMPSADYERILSQACRRVLESTSRGVSLRESIPYDFLRPYPSILFGLETACLSYCACREGRSPYHLFDNPFTRGEQGITINGLVWMGTYEEMMGRMEEKLAAGFRCIKIKIGAIDWERELSLIRALRERFPSDVVQIRLDANGGFSPDIALERLQQLAPYAIHSIEQPIRAGQWEAMAELCRQTPIPIGLDEELIGVNEPAAKAALLETIRPQYIILKPSLHGGLAGAEEWMRLADERHIGHWATSALESNVGLNCIAGWCGERPCKLPSGLGTGQLFVHNYDAIHLAIRGQELWSPAPASCDDEISRERAFLADYHTFLSEWYTESPTITVHTSGSTGSPTPLVVEKQRMAHSARTTLQFLGLKPGDSALLCMPLRYIAGKMMIVRAIVGQLRLQLVAPTSHPLRRLAATLADFPSALPRFIALTPMQALTTLRTPAERDLLVRIPRIIIGGGAISAELQAALQDCQGEVYSTYGMTETLSHIAMRRLNGPQQSPWYTPLPGVSISQTDDGRLALDAPEVCPHKLITNDLCELREDSTFRILGRRDNVVCSGGIKLSLEDLETRLADIGTPFLLTAVPDPLLGEALTLLHTGPTPDAALIAERLERYERPRHIFCVPELPLTETDKPARSEARRIALQRLKDKLDTAKTC